MTVDLSTRYLGMKLANPIVVAACPLTGELDILHRLQEFGAAAVVLPSLFEEQIEPTAPQEPPTPASFESLGYFHELKEYNRGPGAYLAHVANAKKAISIPVIGSLNATMPGEWVHYAKRIQDAGADALELNIYFIATNPDVTGREIESRYVKLVSEVRNEISIPLAVKVGPYFTAFPNVARRLVEAGADGLVLFNRFLQPNIDLDTQRVVPHLTLSTPDEMRVSMRWIALLYGRLNASLAATTGVHFADDAIKMLLAGADVVMVASTLYRHGVEVLRTLVDGVGFWLENNDYHSLEQMKGNLSQRKCPDEASFERANYTKTLASFLNQNDGSSEESGLIP